MAERQAHFRNALGFDEHEAHPQEEERRLVELNPFLANVQEL